jgi:3-oxoacyl-[acyl-carrier protein] reductase
VTGGSAGIGAATARALAWAGVRVVVGFHTNRDAAEALIDEIGGERAVAVRVDVTNPGDVVALVKATIDSFGRLDVLVNNAGALIRRSPLAELPIEDWNSTLATNLTGTFLCCREAIPHLRQQPGATIVNMSSSSAFTGGSGGSIHYGAAKAGVIALTKGLARELAPWGIRVNAIAPAAVATAFHDKVSPVIPIADWPSLIPLGRVATPDDVANAVVYLASDQSSFTTGQTYHVNGGLLMA